MARTRKTVVRWAARLGLSLVLTVALAEVGARLYLHWRTGGISGRMVVADRELGVRMRPGFSGLDMCGKPTEINEQGFRSPPIETPKPDGRFRVIALGDSITYGYGVAAEETFPLLLAEALRARGMEDVETVNAGTSGYSSYQGFVLLRDRVIELQPDVVLFSFMNNDRFESLGRPHAASTFRKSHDRHARTGFFAGTGIARLIEGSDLEVAAQRSERLPHAELGLGPSPGAHPPPGRPLVPVDPDDPRLDELAEMGTLESTVSPERHDVIVRRVAALAQRHGIRVVFLNFYDGAYQCEGLRDAAVQLAAGRFDEAEEGILDYFGTAPWPGTSNSRLKNFDHIANAMLLEVYEGRGTAAGDRLHYFPRRSIFRRRVVHLDTTYTRIVSRAAGDTGVDALDFRDLEHEDYFDYIHLSARGHDRVAERIADLLAGG